MASAKAALLLELGKALGCVDAGPSEDRGRRTRALPARLYYTGPFDYAAQPRVTIAEPSLTDLEGRELARRGQERLWHFIMAREAARKRRSA